MSNPKLLDYFETKIKALLNKKVDKIPGKGLSTEDYTTAEKEKLAGIPSGGGGGGGSITVDSAMSSTSANPVQNKVIYSALRGKVDKVQGKGLSTEDFTTEEKEKLAELDPSPMVIDDALDSTSTNPVQNKVISQFSSLNYTVYSNRVTVLESSVYRVMNFVIVYIKCTANQALSGNTIIQDLPSPGARQGLSVSYPNAWGEIRVGGDGLVVGGSVPNGTTFVVSGIYHTLR